MRIRWLAFGLTLSTAASANIVERVVAVVEDRPILLSEVRERSVPEMNAPNAIEGEVHRRVLEKLIVEQLVQKEAQRAHLFVSSDEIDKALSTKASELRVTETQLLEEARREGFTEQGFRDEMRRQLLEGKLVQLRIGPSVRVTEQDARNAYAVWAHDFQERQPIDLTILGTLRPSAQTLAMLPTITQLAPTASICDLASQLLAPGTFGCERRTLSQKALPTAIGETIAKLAPGEATPIQFPSEVDILQLLGRLSPEPFETVRKEMLRLGYQFAFERARDAYIADLRRRAYVDVRL